MIPLIRQEVMLLLGEGDFLFYMHLKISHSCAIIKYGVIMINTILIDHE